jgi:prevent-host-death family protein
MAEVGIRALKQNASQVVARAAAGEIITITDRGRRVAQIMPLDRSRLEGLIEAGLAVPPSGPLSALPAPVDDPGGPSLSSILAEMRDDARA